MARIDSVENAVETVKKMVRATAPPSERVGDGPSVETLTERLAQLEKEGGTIKDLVQRIGDLEKEGAAKASPPPPQGAAGADESRARAIVLAVANLRDAVSRDVPFDGPLEALTAVAGNDPEVKVAKALLAKNAAAGIPTLATLQARFQDVAGKIVLASRSGKEDGWMMRAASRLSSLVTWRRIDDREDGTSVDAVVARAEARLAAGNLGAAAAAIEGLSGNPKAAAAAAPWLADAKARVAAERAVAALHVHAVSLLTTGKE